VNYIERSLLLGFLAATTLLAQTPAPQALRPEFEVASIRPTGPAQDGQTTFGVHIDGAMVIIHSYSLRDYIELAYRVRDYQISGPDWLDTVKFDVNAKFPDIASRNQLPEMMKSLLEERFKLAVHIEKKDYSIYALIVSKNGPHLKESAADASPDPSGQDKNNTNVTLNAGTSGGRGSSVVDLGHGASISSSGGRIEARKVTMPDLVETLWRYVDRPVIDMTGLTGKYDLSLPYGVEELRNMLRIVHVDRPIPDNALPPASIFDSLKAVGLMLEARKSAMDVVVVDRMEKTPVAN
jgi:uncharacterized protein (TIGR03435 family)